MTVLASGNKVSCENGPPAKFGRFYRSDQRIIIGYLLLVVPSGTVVIF